MIKIVGSTHTGRVRSSNQDRFEYKIIAPNLAYAIVCDGMGGENGGNIASAVAVEQAVRALSRDLSPTLGASSIRSLMQSVIAGANAAVFAAAEKDPTLSGMGTTMVLAIVLNRTLFIGHVGDSRVYLAGPAGETQLSRDHTVVQMLLDNGEIEADEVDSHPKRHYITRAVGVSALVEPDFAECTLGPADYALICSDGLYHYLKPGQLPTLLKHCVEQGSADALIDLANRSGGSDNITAVVLHQSGL